MKSIINILILSVALLSVIGLEARTIDSPASIQSDLTCSLPLDTFWICTGETIRVQAQVQGGTSPYTYQWGASPNPGQSDSSFLDISHTNPGIDTLFFTVIDQLNDTSQCSAIVQSLGNCVWPGDANGNGIANHVDVLNIGRGMGFMGPERPLRHTNWIGQASHSWGTHAPDGADYTHADADGDGLIHEIDIASIAKNYTFTPAPVSPPSSQGTPIRLVLSDTTVQEGDTVRIDIMLGDAFNRADSVYGLAFSLTFDDWIIDSGSVDLDLSNSWLGQENTDLIGFSKDFPQAGQIDIAVTRTDQAMRGGYGAIGGLTITIDDIIGKTDKPVDIRLSLSNVTLEAFNGNAIDVAVRPSLLTVGLEPSLAEPAVGLELYPNPASGLMKFAIEQGFIEQLEVYDIFGKKVAHINITNPVSEYQWNIPEGLSGAYMIRLETSRGTIQRTALITN
ncbi:MAG: T9SS type A sorting domain-containing protein [Bacteroidia bacterium]